MRVAGFVIRSFESLSIAACLAPPLSAPAPEPTPHRQLTRDIYQEPYRPVKALAGGK